MHPHMFVRKEDFPTFRKRVAYSPWKELGESAIDDASSILPPEGDDYVALCGYIRDVTGCCALAFILDPKNAKRYQEKILSAIDMFDKNHGRSVYGGIYTKSGDNWLGSIPPGCAFVSCAAALDVIYSDTSEKDREKAERTLGGVAKLFWENTEVHRTGVWGVRGIWAVYNGDWEKALSIYKAYRPSFDETFTADGGQLTSSEYAVQRYLLEERFQKIALPVALEFNNKINNFYSDPRIKNAMEWLTGYSCAPNGEYWPLGDTMFGRKVIPEECIGAYNAGKYSRRAAAQAAFLLNGRHVRGTFFKYAFLDKQLPKPRPPKSRIFPQNCAYFYENFKSQNSLAGVYYNIAEVNHTSGHIHKEVGSVSLYAYGEMLMANAGYNYFGQGCEGFGWDYIFHSALSSSCVLVNYEYGDPKKPSVVNEFSDRSGTGIEQGLISEVLSFARGASGRSLEHAIHERSFVMVNSDGESSGYFVVTDRVDTGGSDDKVTEIWRPLSETFYEAEESTEYEWRVRRSTEKGVSLSVFLAAPPDTVEFIQGIAASCLKPQPLKSLLAHYKTDQSGTAKTITVLFPFDSTHKKADMRRVRGNNAFGVELRHAGGICDLFLTSEKQGRVGCSAAGLLFEGKTAAVRFGAKGIKWIFAENATYVKCGALEMHSDHKVSIIIENNRFIVYDETGGMVDVCKKTYVVKKGRSVYANLKTSQKNVGL